MDPLDETHDPGLSSALACAGAAVARLLGVAAAVAACGGAAVAAAPASVAPTAAGVASGAAADERTAAAPRLGLPIRCTPGVDCFVQNYVDRDPGPGWRDFACGALSYDGHHGTDFRVPSLAEMAVGVEVVAAAPGRVVAVRDGEPDRSVRERGRAALAGRDAGNGVRIAHGGGWETQYSHLKRGSVRVRAGDAVDAGAVLGLVGLSGNTEFPHVDFVVRRDGRPVDPFDPSDPSDPAPRAAPARDACPSGPAAPALWRDDVADALRYRASGVLITGFAGEAVDRARAQSGGYRDAPPAQADALVFFVEAFGVRAGDAERFELVGPDGAALLVRETPVDRTVAVRFAYAGRKRTAARWPAGTYAARYVLLRDGRAVAEARRTITLR